ncbi:MAG: DUF839 domain-containing protein [Ilumatobacteraceae bacterium]
MHGSVRVHDIGGRSARPRSHQQSVIEPSVRRRPRHPNLASRSDRGRPGCDHARIRRATRTCSGGDGSDLSRLDASRPPPGTSASGRSRSRAGPCPPSPAVQLARSILGASIDGSGQSFPYDGFTAEQQEQSIGIGHDGMWYFGNNEGGLLCINHEYGTNPHVFGADAPASLEQVRLSQAAHGVSVVGIRKTATGWRVWNSPNNRRIHVNTPVAFSGPAASSPLLQNPAGNAPAGTVNNCANGYTPWGTYLTCEENFNGRYFGPPVIVDRHANQRRYGFAAGGFGYGWHAFDPRFDLSDPAYVNEHHRFGWSLEIDPNRPDLPPVKRTALGRSSTKAPPSSRRIAGSVYMGDDERSTTSQVHSIGNWRQMTKAGRSPLDEGTLYVARVLMTTAPGSAQLSPANPALAADARRSWSTPARPPTSPATPMDRPRVHGEQGRGGLLHPHQQHPPHRTQSRRTRYAEPGRPHHPTLDGDRIGVAFEWDIFALARTSPIGTARCSARRRHLLRPRTVGSSSRPTATSSPRRERPAARRRSVHRRVPSPVHRRGGCEVTGITRTPNKRVLFVNLQHPGNGDPAVTNFPAEFVGAAGPVPRDSTIVIWKDDGYPVGS